MCWIDFRKATHTSRIFSLAKALIRKIDKVIRSNHWAFVIARLVIPFVQDFLPDTVFYILVKFIVNHVSWLTENTPRSSPSVSSRTPKRRSARWLWSPPCRCASKCRCPRPARSVSGCRSDRAAPLWESNCPTVGFFSEISAVPRWFRPPSPRLGGSPRDRTAGIPLYYHTAPAEVQIHFSMLGLFCSGSMENYLFVYSNIKRVKTLYNIMIP